MYPIPTSEFQARRASLLGKVQKQGLSGVILFDRTYILYYAGFSWIPTERPVAFLMTAGGRTVLFVPGLEAERAHAEALVDEIVVYPEYPDDPHPLVQLWDAAVKWGFGPSYGADQDGYPWVFGYQGPALSEMAGSRPFPCAAWVEAQMMVKSPAEIALIRESVKWANLAHTLLCRYTRAGVTETEACRRASTEATMAMLDALGPHYRSGSPYFEGASATYRGQVGRGASQPGALAGHFTFRAGDVLISEARAPIWGYDSELERTMFIGRPSDEQRRLFEQVRYLGEVALGALRPGIPCAEVDRAVRTAYAEQGLLPYWRHHTGHSIGLRYHEGPFLDVHDATIIRPGMVFTIEPGLYVPDVGGFRHSDTVLVTEDGVEVLTYFPRDLDSLILPA
jgi:Xaa-Pro aminopeptidase